VEKAVDAALAAYRNADPATDQAFRAWEEAIRPRDVFNNPPEPIRKAFLIAEAQVLSHIAEVARDRALRNRRNL
jgi:hypothetical protein